MKYAIFNVTPVKGKFKRISDWFKTKEEAVRAMNESYPSRTKVMWSKGGDHGLVCYNESCYR